MRALRGPLRPGALLDKRLTIENLGLEIGIVRNRTELFDAGSITDVPRRQFRRDPSATSAARTRNRATACRLD
jgi:hypothetical protein